MLDIRNQDLNVLPGAGKWQLGCLVGQQEDGMRGELELCGKKQWLSSPGSIHSSGGRQQKQNSGFWSPTELVFMNSGKSHSLSVSSGAWNNNLK